MKLFHGNPSFRTQYVCCPIRVIACGWDYVHTTHFKYALRKNNATNAIEILLSNNMIRNPSLTPYIGTVNKI